MRPYKQVPGLKEWKQYTKEEKEEKIKTINHNHAQILFHILSNAEKQSIQSRLNSSRRYTHNDQQICTDQSNIETAGAILLFYKKNVVDQSFTPTEEEIKYLIFKNKSLLHTPGQWVLLEEGFTEEKNKEEQKNKIQAAINAEWMADYVKEIKNAFLIKTGNNPVKTNQNNVRNRLSAYNKKFFTPENKREGFCTDHSNLDTAISIVNLYYEIQIENAKDEQEKGNFITQREEWEEQVAEVNALPTQHQQNKIKSAQNLLSASSAGSSSNSVVGSQLSTTISDLESDNDEPLAKQVKHDTELRLRSSSSSKVVDLPEESNDRSSNASPTPSTYIFAAVIGEGFNTSAHADGCLCDHCILLLPENENFIESPFTRICLHGIHGECFQCLVAAL